MNGSGKAAIGRSLLAFAMLGACVLSAPIRAQADPAPGFVDAGDLDPALFPLLDALLHVRDAPGPGALRSITTDGSGVMLHFASLVVLLPAGRPDDATVLPLVASLLDRQSDVTLVPDSTVTYGLLATAAPPDAGDVLTPHSRRVHYRPHNPRRKRG